MTMFRNEYNQNPIPPSVSKGKEAHTHLIFRKDLHKKPNEQLFPKTGGHSATVIKTNSGDIIISPLMQ